MEYWLKCNWDKESFPLVVREIFQTLPSHELQLPDIVARLIPEKAETLLQQESVLDLLEDFGGLTIAMLKEVHGYLRSSEAERERLIALCEKDTFGRILMSKINQISRCRHCQIEFNARVDSEYDFGTFRCGRCRTRH